MQKVILGGIIAIMVGFFVAATVKADTPTPSPTGDNTPTPTMTTAPTQAVQGSTTVPSGAPATGFGY